MAIKGIYTGSLKHKRHHPKVHQFNYPFCLFEIDITAKPYSKTTLFSYNCFNLFSLFETDYITTKKQSIYQKVCSHLNAEGIPTPQKIRLLTNPRFLNRAFNPFNAYYCYFKHTSTLPDCILVEVNNTFKEKHLYLLSKPEKNSNSKKLHFKTQKTFHVSPFFKCEGYYQFQFSSLCNQLQIHINYFKDKTPLLSASFVAKKHTKNFNFIALKQSVKIISTMIRILNEAFKLHVLKALPAFKKPIPYHKDSLSCKTPNWFEARCLKGVFKWLNHLKEGSLIVILPNKEQRRFGTGKPSVTLTIYDYRFFKYVAWQADLGFASAYIKSLCDCSNLAHLAKIFAKNATIFDKKPSPFTQIGKKTAYLFHTLRKNTTFMSQKNIAEHYDLGNDFFDLFLDQKTRMYSAAIFKTQETQLEEAQVEKTNRLINLLGPIKNQDHILEIGSGWGFVAKSIHQKTGSKVSTLTLSKEQKRFIDEENKKNQYPINVKLQDYRATTGQFDGVISIEMIEAVGKDYLDTYFKCCANLLKPGKAFVLQAITFNDERYKIYEKSVDFIQRYIFPGGHLPSLTIIKQLSQKYGLVLKDSFAMGEHYASTLEAWKARFLDQKEAILKLGFDESFIRKWHYYFDYCVGGFEAGYINNYQLRFIKK